MDATREPKKSNEVSRPEQMISDPSVFDTEMSARARARQLIPKVLSEKPYTWHRAPPSILPRGGEYLSNGDIGQYRALLWPVVVHEDGGAQLLAYRVRLRGQADASRVFATLAEARAWGRL